MKFPPGVLLITALVFPITPLAAQESARKVDYDCGFISLYNLLRLEGFAGDMSALERSLPIPSPGGYSMKELRDGAFGRGLSLVGTRLRRGQKINRPALFFLGEGRHGHYVVARPVGHTGELVQLLDPNHDPVVMDQSELESVVGWTGLALMRSNSNWRFWLALSTSVICSLAFSGFLVVRTIGRRSGFAAITRSDEPQDIPST